MDKNEIINNIRGKGTAKYIRHNHPDEYSDIINNYPGNSWTEKLYNYLYNKPEHRCIICGATDTRFISLTKGYRDTCSNKCLYIKRNNIVREKYGVNNISKLESVKEKKKQTLINNFGSESEGRRIMAERRDITIREKYGVNNVSELESVKEKKKQTLINNFGSIEEAKRIASLNRSRTCMCRYGVQNPSQLPEIHDKIRSTNIEKYGEYDWNIYKAKTTHQDLLESRGGVWVCTCSNQSCNQCQERQYNTHHQLHNDRKRLGVELCTKINPVISGQSTMEGNIKKWINEQLNINFVEHDRTILGGKEIDIYIPSKSLAIEVNGCYWHSDHVKPKHYHYNKYIKCNNNNIQLIQIWEDWWINKQDIVKSIISSKLGTYKKRIYARKCSIRRISPQESRVFEMENHIQGYTPSSIKYGLFYNGELVSEMTFGKTRNGISTRKSDPQGTYELIRFCNKLNTQIIGGASKLFKTFIREYNPSQIISYSSNDISMGGLYKILGFEMVSVCRDTYWYIDKYFNRYHRFTFTKSQIIRKGLAPQQDNWTEKQAMDLVGYYRIYDSGTSKWVLKLHEVV